MKYSNTSQCILHWTHTKIAQNMLDYDYLCDRWPSVAAFFSSWWSGKQHKLFYWSKEIFIPTINNWQDVENYSNVDTLINLASFRSCTAVNKEALETGYFSKIFTIAEWVAERETRELIALAKKSNTALLGPSIVWWLICGTYKIGHTAWSLSNILKSRLYRPGSVGIVSKSGSMVNEFMRVVSKHSDWTHTAFQVWWDRFPMYTFSDIVKYYETVEWIKMIVLLGEVGNRDELDIADMISSGEITKPVVVWCMGDSADHLSSDIQFGHAGAKANSEEEKAVYKNEYLRKAWAHVSQSYDDFGELIEHVYTKVLWWELAELEDHPQEILSKVAVIKERKKSNFTSSISDERWDELTYNGIAISEFVNKGSIANVIWHLWLKKDLPAYATKFIDSVLILLADHGPAVSGATNTIVTARAGKDIVSSLVAGLMTVGPRFWWAVTGAGKRLVDAVDRDISPIELVSEMKCKGVYIQWIGHKVKSLYNPDKRCELMRDIAKEFPSTKHLDFAIEVEDLTTQKKPNLILNVDGHIAAMLLDMLSDLWYTAAEIKQMVNADLFNAFFVLARSIGFIGHYLDQQRLNEGLYRTPWDDILKV